MDDDFLVVLDSVCAKLEPLSLISLRSVKRGSNAQSFNGSILSQLSHFHLVALLPVRLV